MKVRNDFQSRADQITQMRINEREPAMYTATELSQMGDINSAEGNAYATGQQDEELSYHDMDDDMKMYFNEALAEKRDADVESATQTVQTAPAKSDQLASPPASNKKRNLILGGVAALGVFFFMNKE